MAAGSDSRVSRTATAGQHGAGTYPLDVEPASGEQFGEVVGGEAAGVAAGVRRIGHQDDVGRRRVRQFRPPVLLGEPREPQHQRIRGRQQPPTRAQDARDVAQRVLGRQAVGQRAAFGDDGVDALGANPGQAARVADDDAVRGRPGWGAASAGAVTDVTRCPAAITTSLIRASKPRRPASGSGRLRSSTLIGSSGSHCAELTQRHRRREGRVRIDAGRRAARSSSDLSKRAEPCAVTGNSPRYPPSRQIRHSRRASKLPASST